MKKLLILLSFVLSFCIYTSCAPASASDGKEESTRLEPSDWNYQIIDLSKDPNVPFGSVIHFEYNGHKYIKFISRNKQNGCAVILDPDYAPVNEKIISIPESLKKDSDYWDW